MSVFERIEVRAHRPVTLARSRSVPQRIVKALPPLFPSWRASSPNWVLAQHAALGSYIQEGFNGNALIYAAIMYKARAFASAPLRAYVGTPENPEPAPYDHPLNVLLRRPNSFQSSAEFIQAMTVFFNLAGTAYLLKAYVSDRRDGAPDALYALRPDCVDIVPSPDKGLLGYAYTPLGGMQNDMVPILPQDMIAVKLPNPGDPLGGVGAGQSPLASMAKSGDVDNAVTDFLKLFFERGAMPPGMLTFDIPLNDDLVADMKKRWREQYGGVEQWSDVVILDKHAKYERLSQTLQEMGFEGLDARNETRVLMPFGVPPILVGAKIGLERATYSNYEEARKAFWEDTADPELKLFESEYDTFLTLDGAFIRHDRSTVPALRGDVNQQSDAALKLWRMGVPAKYALQTAGLKVQDFPGNEISYVTLQGTSQPLPADQAPDASESDDLLDESTQKARKRTYDPRTMQKALDAIAVSWETRFGDASVRMFERDRREIGAIITETQINARQRKGTPDWTRLEARVLDYLRTVSRENWRGEFVPLLEGVMLESGREWAGALGIQFDVRNLQGELWFENYTLQFAQPISETSATTIHEVIAQGLAEGWSNAQLENKLGQVFEQWARGNLTPEDFAWLTARMPLYRREAIARTETIRASGAGAYNLARSWGVQRKAWLATDDDRTRDDHRAAEKEFGEGGTTGPISLNRPFRVGGYDMMYPGDAGLGAPPSEFVNCRCTLLLLEN